MNPGIRLGWLENVDPRFALGLQALAFWPTWRWYALRLGDSGEEAWGIAAILGAALVMIKSRGGGRTGGESGAGAAKGIEGRSGPAGRIGLAPVLATCLYAVTYPFLPPLPRAVLALAAMGCLLPSLGMGRPAILHGVGFLLLSLPVMPSLQFYLGYPLRVASGETAARLINLAGFPVIRDGTLLTWREHAVFIDAPCSGVKILWAGMVLALALSALRGHGAKGTLAMGAAAFVAVALGNVLRTTALFFLETGVVQGPAWAHAGVGVMAFVAAAAFMSWLARAIPRPGSTWGYGLA